MIELHITDLIGEVVTATATELNTNISYLFGDVNEVVQKLSIMSKNSSAVAVKYPLIAMITDVPERRGTAVNVQSVVRIDRIVIVTFTDRNYHAEERMKYSFKPILTPIYLEFVKQIRLNSNFILYSELLIPHTKINRLSWGQSALFTEREAGSDFIDAIDIQNLELIIKNKIC